MRAKSHYERCCDVLDVSPGASMESIERSFRELIKVWHPDRFGDNPSLQIRATQKTSEITKAFRWIRRNQAAQHGREIPESTPERVLRALRDALARYMDRHPDTSQEMVQRAVRALWLEMQSKPEPERVYPFRWLQNATSGKWGRAIIARRRVILAWTAVILVYIFLGAR